MVLEWLFKKSFWKKGRFILVVICISCVFSSYGFCDVRQEYIAQELKNSNKVWVFFTDKGEASENFGQDSMNLSEKTIQRRLKHKMTDPSLEIDRMINSQYIRMLESIGIIIHQQSRWLNAVSVSADDVQLGYLAKLPFVKKIQPVLKFRKDGLIDEIRQMNNLKEINQVNYGESWDQLNQIQVTAAHQMGYIGDGVLICMMDTGFNLQHDVFSSILGSGRLIAQHDFINNDDNVENENGEIDTQDNHGTVTWSVAGGFADGHLIGAAYGASFLLAKTEDIASETPVEEDNWIAAAEWAESLGADIFSSSLGYIDWYQFEDLDGDTAPITIAADIAAQLGVVVCTAIGNQYGGLLIAPADADSVITVGSVDINGDVSGFESFGPTYDGRIKPEVLARGSSTFCAAPDENSSFMTTSGTSLSTPLVAGCTAILLQAHPDWTAMQVREALMQTATNSTAPNNHAGWGIVQVVQAIEYEFQPIELNLLLFQTQQISETIQIDWQFENFSQITGFNVYRCESGECLAEPLNKTQLANHITQYVDHGIFPDQTFYYRLEVISKSGGASVFTSPEILFKPDKKNNVLYQNMPNPFSDQTVIRFNLDKASNINVNIYDITGRLVRNLIRNRTYPVGTNEIIWNGANDDGSKLSNGTYFYVLKTGDSLEKRNLILLR